LFKSCTVRLVDATLRIGELSRRSGVSPELLRAWERRYGLLRPMRSAGGLRLYSADDVDRVRLMREHMAAGLAAAEAAELASGAVEDAGGARPALDLQAVRAELSGALDRFDEPRAQAILDALLAAATVESILSEVVLPYLRDLGARWERGTASVAQEHFASNVLRGRLLALARGWGRGVGPLALVGCLPGERHELGLIAFALALRARGWRIAYLGADTPLDTVDDTARSLAPALIVLVASTAERVQESAQPLRALAERHRIALGGTGASEVAAPPGVIVLTGDPVAEAERVTTIVGDAP
jgi:DNA-binding transcriptional MerR regulator